MIEIGRRPWTWIVLASLVVLGAVGCGGSGGPGGSTGGAGGSAGSTGSSHGIRVVMTEFKYSPSTISASAGTVTFDLVNQGRTAHDMVVADSSGKVLGKSSLVGAGQEAEFSVQIPQPGTYQVYCDLPGHREAGMTGTLDVG